MFEFCSGLSTLEEGAVEGQKIVLKTQQSNVLRMSVDSAKENQNAKVVQVG